MSIADDVAVLFAANDLGVLGRNMFTNNMPETPDECCAIYSTAGAAPQGGFSTPGILHERPGVQVRFRGRKHDADSPYDLIEQAYQLLMTVQGELVNSTMYLTFQPTQAPFILERDGNNRVVWAFNAMAKKEL